MTLRADDRADQTLRLARRRSGPGPGSTDDALHPFSAGGGYLNMLMDDEGDDRVEAAYGENFPRLVEAKRRYDPENLWHVNKNIPTS